MMSKKPLPLERKDSVETDPEFGTTIHRTVYQRGLLKRESITYDDIGVGLSALAKEDPRKKFEDLLVRARAVLRKAQLPTDEDQKDWWRIVEDRTELLSTEQAAVTLIRATNATLRKNFDEDALTHIWYLTRAAYVFELVAREINDAAVSGQRAESGRKEGPKKRTAGRQWKQVIIRQAATAYWERVPVNRGKLAPTVDGIKDALDRRLEAEGLKPIGRSQITTYLREIVRDSAEQEG
jgi:hypothetical protein